MQIAKVFKEHNVSLSEVARRMGISKGTLSDAIRRDNMHTDTLRRIAKAAGCNVSEFFADEDKPNEERPSVAQKSPFTVMIDCDGQIYRADDTKELEAIVAKLRHSGNCGTPTKSQALNMTTTTFRYLDDIKEYMQVLCRKHGITNAYGISLPDSFDRNHHWGIIYATDAEKNVLAASPFWKNRNGLYEVQNELVRVGNMILQKQFQVTPFKKSVPDFETNSDRSYRGGSRSSDHSDLSPLKIGQIIKDKGLTITEVAKKAGLPMQSLSRIIHSGKARPSTLEAIAVALGYCTNDTTD